VRDMINGHLRSLQLDVNEEDGDVNKTLHCLRHRFKDRLRKTSAREEVIDAIMGRASDKPDHGHTDLAAKLEVMNQLVFSRAHVALVAWRAISVDRTASRSRLRDPRLL